MSTGAEIESAPKPQPQLSRPRTRPWQLLGEWVALGAAFLALLFAIDVCAVVLTGRGSEHRDFVSYWASGQLFVHHQNPYDAGAIRQLELAHGFSPDRQVLIVRNPPSALVLVAPLGFLSYRAAALVWSLLLAGCWIASIRILFLIQGRPDARLRVLGYPVPRWLVLSLFAPALLCILAGQTGLFALLGVVLFLRFHPSQPFLAGVALWLCALKPHLFLPFAAILLLWIIVSQSYAVIAGTVAALGASSALAFLVDHSAWSQYAQMMRTIGIEREFIPCLGIALRFALNPNLTWLQYIPAAAGCAWAAWFYWIRRDRWNWLEQGSLVVLVSVLVSPYGWLTDQVLAVPALVWAACRTGRANLLALALASSAIEAAVLSNIYMHSPFYLWTAPAWLAWYLFATHTPKLHPGISVAPPLDHSRISV
jgi:Glycosyltransferase family 87